jgi:REP element-mobilizing transposase RayT
LTFSPLRAASTQPFAPNPENGNMPRIARTQAIGAVHHFTSNFVNGEHRLRDPACRSHYLRRVAEVSARTDWRLLAYCLMESHTHWGAEQRASPPQSFIQPLHTAVARWLNRTQGRRGPVYAERPYQTIHDAASTALLIAYIHNNPVRAGLVTDPSDSDWTSHRAVLGLEAAPPWLDVKRTLHLCGFSSSPSGRVRFHDFVLSRRGDQGDPALDPAGHAAVRAEIRARTGAPVEVGAPALSSDQPAVYPILGTVDSPVRRPWPGDLGALLALLSIEAGITAEILRSRDRSREVVQARRLAVLTATRHLHRPLAEISTALGISTSAASRLLSREPAQLALLTPRASRLAAHLEALHD